MKIIDVNQNSLEWLVARAGIVTASEFDALVTPKWEPRKGLGVESYLCRKLAEKWIGPLPSFQTLDMEFGKVLEEEARPWLSFELGQDIKQVGLMTTDDGKIGASPDGVMPDKGVELKCPEAPNHVKYLMSGKVPDDYLAQVHGSMFVSGFNEWIFCSYNRRFPKLVLTVERDDKIQSVFAEVLPAFIEKLDSAYARLCEINGGPPKRAAIQPKPEPTADDDITP